MYAQIVGVILLLLGIVGLIMGDPADGLFGILNIDIAEDIIHLVVGAVLAYIGFANVDASTVRTVVGAIGVILLLTGIVGFLDARLFGLLQHPYRVTDNIVHLLLGLAGVAAAYLVPADRSTTRTTM
jgi:hypothetical protein